MDNPGVASESSIDDIFITPSFEYEEDYATGQNTQYEHWKTRFDSFIGNRQRVRLLPASASALADFGIYFTTLDGVTRCYSCQKVHSNWKDGDPILDPSLHETHCHHFQSYRSGYHQSSAQGTEPFWHEDSGSQYAAVPNFVPAPAPAQLQNVQSCSVLHYFTESFGEFLSDASSLLTSCFSVDRDRTSLMAQERKHGSDEQRNSKDDA